MYLPIIISILFTYLNTLYSQNSEPLILRTIDNNNWITILRNTKDKSQQIEVIKEKIISDSIYFSRIRNGINIVDYNSRNLKNRKIGYYEGKVGFLLKIFEKYYNLNILENNQTLEILKLLSSENIESIEINNGGLTTAIKYGSMGRDGTIVFISINKKLKKKIKKILIVRYVS